MHLHALATQQDASSRSGPSMAAALRLSFEAQTPAVLSACTDCQQGMGSDTLVKAGKAPEPGLLPSAGQGLPSMPLGPGSRVRRWRPYQPPLAASDSSSSARKQPWLLQLWSRVLYPVCTPRKVTGLVHRAGSDSSSSLNALAPLSLPCISLASRLAGRNLPGVRRRPGAIPPPRQWSSTDLLQSRGLLSLPHLQTLC